MTIANTGKLAGRTLFISGASRGIGKAIALKAAQDGANVVIAAKTATAHPKLPGTVYSAAEEVEKAGGKALACVVDIRDEASVKSAVQAAVEKFGGIDIVVNNASAISLTSTEYTTMKSYDLMNQINARGTFLVSKECIPYLKKSPHPHILNLSPPLNMAPFWFSQHVAYTIAKYGMSMCALGMAAEYRENGIGVNTLWPKTAILTAAVEMLTGPDSAEWSRKPEIVADAAYVILTSDPKKTTGNFFIDEDVVKNAGVTDLTHYACIKENADKLLPDAFLEVPPELIAQSWNKGNLSDVAIKHLEAAGVKTGIKTGASAGAPSSGGGQIEGLFQKIESLLNEDIVKRTNAVFQFEVKGEEAGTWFADLKNGKGAVGRGSPPSQADATLIMDSQNFFNMFSGKLKPASAFMTGKLKIKGDMKKAMALEKLMGGLKSKL